MSITLFISSRSNNPRVTRVRRPPYLSSDNHKETANSDSSLSLKDRVINLSSRVWWSPSLPFIGWRRLIQRLCGNIFKKIPFFRCMTVISAHCHYPRKAKIIIQNHNFIFPTPFEGYKRAHSLWFCNEMQSASPLSNTQPICIWKRAENLYTQVRILISGNIGDILGKIRFLNGPSTVTSDMHFSFLQQCALYVEPENVTKPVHGWVTPRYSPVKYLYQAPRSTPPPLGMRSAVPLGGMGTGKVVEKMEICWSIKI